MLTIPSAPAPAAAALPLFAASAAPGKIPQLFKAATALADLLGQGRPIDARTLRSAMEAASGASDADGAWVWKGAYEAGEAAQVLFLRKFGAAMLAQAGSGQAMLDMLARLAAQLPPQTRRSEESQALQQFSTPITLGFAAARAAALTPADVVLEPSAGTGLLAIFAELYKAQLSLNEIAEARAGLLGQLFSAVPVTRHNAEHIHDHLGAGIRPSVVLMNPPFSASPKVEGRFAEAPMRHIASALARLGRGGRLVAITGSNMGPDQPAWREPFVRLQDKARVVFTATLMVLLHGGSPRGAERIAACWADNRKVAQVVFKPDWARHRNAAPFKRIDQMLEALPIGVIAFPGAGVSANLADKARKMGIPVVDLTKGGAA